MCERHSGSGCMTIRFYENKFLLLLFLFFIYICILLGSSVSGLVRRVQFSFLVKMKCRDQVRGPLQVSQVPWRRCGRINWTNFYIYDMNMMIAIHALRSGWRVLRICQVTWMTLMVDGVTLASYEAIKMASKHMTQFRQKFLTQFSANTKKWTLPLYSNSLLLSLNAFKCLP